MAAVKQRQSMMLQQQAQDQAKAEAQSLDNGELRYVHRILYF